MRDQARPTAAIKNDRNSTSRRATEGHFRNTSKDRRSAARQGAKAPGRRPIVRTSRKRRPAKGLSNHKAALTAALTPGAVGPIPNQDVRSNDLFYATSAVRRRFGATRHEAVSDPRVEKSGGKIKANSWRRHRRYRLRRHTLRSSILSVINARTPSAGDGRWLRSCEGLEGRRQRRFRLARSRICPITMQPKSMQLSWMTNRRRSTSATPTATGPGGNRGRRGKRGGTTGSGNLSAGQASRTGGATSGIAYDPEDRARARNVPPSA